MCDGRNFIQGETSMRTVKRMMNGFLRLNSDGRRPELRDESQAGRPYRRFAGRLLTLLGFIILPVIAGLAVWELAPAAASQSGLVPGETTMSIRIGGRTRTFLLHVPPSYTGVSSVPLVLDLHGLGSNSDQQAGLSGFRRKSDEAGFIVAWPQGVGNSWNAF